MLCPLFLTSIFFTSTYVVRGLLMEKIAIVGSPGAGKTTLARELGSLHKIKVFHLDRMFWQRDWKRKHRDVRIDILQKCAMEKQWIIEGTYINSSEARFKEASTIIFIDLPSLLCLYRIIKRHCIYRGLPRRDIPKGCTDELTPHRVFRILFFRLVERPKLKRILGAYESKKVITFRSRKEIEDFLTRQTEHLNATVSTECDRLPVISGR